MEGTIRKLVRERGFGFIRVRGHEIFFHRTALEDIEFESLKEGQSVEFKLERGERGLQAANVRLTGTHTYGPECGQQDETGSRVSWPANIEHG